jgi:hypothetical protein
MLAHLDARGAQHSSNDASETLSHGKVSMIAIKAFAIKLDDSPLRDVLLAEKDEVTAEEFASRLPIFLRLLGRAE